ncbi:tetratricopeptide repeat protein 28-like [Argiope bruennichi]|uniref:Tetratricopeptide repeat protein 28 like protein n=1 Tax=Argiope bruennichi TaxID=94029 RepID=A0A8T0FPA3_ARGBR|nr:tetratricopeptide repeat protein 28-like [Argiope bruennichi]KAF8792165.1 Tetratricopeptide repeat protein 28 like protein [Argiope bruennichi]
MELSNQRDPEEVEVNFESEPSNKSLFLEKVRQSNAACQSGDFNTAIRLYTDAIVLDPGNHVLYSNRSAAYIKVGKYGRALQDAIKARELHSKWPKAYYRQGVALQCLGRHADSLAAFASGLAQDSKNVHLLAGLVEAAMKSPLRATLEPTYRQLQAMRLDKSPFVITSVVGQELLATGHHAAAVVVLESALRIGTCSLKLRGSVFSALSSAYWALNTLDRAIAYMQQDLAVAKSLGDQAGECRAHGNLGSAYFSKGNYKEALTSHRYQLVLAMKCKDTYAAASALTSLGHVYTAIGDYPNALASHKQCVQLVRQIGDGLQEAREIGNVGAVYLAMGDFDQAVECHLEHLRLAKQLGNKVEEARAYSNLGSSHHYRRNFEQAITFHNHVLRLAQELGDKTIEARAYAGLGHAARCIGDYPQAKKWHEKQLDMALSTKDKVSEGRACSNLGIVYQLLGDFDAAHKLHQAHLNIARALGDKAGMGRAYGNIGNAYSAMGRYEQAIKFHKQELTISKEVNDRSAEASTHGNLAVAYQALGMHEMALLHYHSHLNIAQELKDTAGEACALCNLGNCHSSRGEFSQAVPYYESFLRLCQEISDVEGEAKACHFLGYAHYCLGNYKDAIHYYEQDLELAKGLQDRLSMGRAYCNLGLSHLALGDFQAALECQRYFLAVAQMMKHLQGKFRALGNLGDVLMKMKDPNQAVKVYQKQLILAKQSGDRSLEAVAYGALGLCHRQMQCFDKALGYHTQELTLRQELCDVRGECKAHGHLGAVHISLGNYTNAMKCYEEQLERAKELRDCALETQALGNLGISRLNMGHFEDAIGYFEQQLALLEQLGNNNALIDKGRAYGNLGDCYDALGDFEEAVKCHEQYLAIALKGQSLRDQERAYRGLGNSHRCIGNLQQALVCFEKRLVVSHELGNISAKAAAYGELGGIHSSLGNFEQAIACLEHQLNLAREMNDRAAEADAACGLGTVYQQMGDQQRALKYHQMDLDIAEETNNMAAQGRAYGNLGVAHESLGSFEQAILYQEQHLSIAAQINDKVAKTFAYSSLGRVHHALGNTPQAVAYLQQGLLIAEQLGRREDEARIRHRLGLALWGNDDLEGAQQQLYRATDLFETIRREARGTSDYKLSLFDLQTASYQALQRVLVGLGRYQEALVVAERGRTRAFVDLLLERQTSSSHSILNFNPANVDQIYDIVSRQKATVLYYSIAAGYLYTWLIVPNKGIVKFHESNISDMDNDSNGDANAAVPSASSLLEQYIMHVREALGVDIPTSQNGTLSETESEAGDLWNQQLEELGDRLNQENDRTGFLRMVNRNHLFNSSNYSLSSLFSVGSLGGSIASGLTSRPGSIRSRRSQWQGPAPLHALYDLLIAPIEEYLPRDPDLQELLLVLDGDLYLVPFAILKNSSCDEYLCERFSLTVLPSISALKASQRSKIIRQNNSKDIASALVVGNPKIPAIVSEQWGWNDIPHAEQEATLVGEILSTKAICGSAATKENILSQLSQAECIHFATHISWKLSAVVLSPGEFMESSRHYAHSSQSETGHENNDYSEEPTSELSSTDLPPLSEFLLTAADILNLRLSARLVVISSCHTRNHHGRAHSDGVVGLTRALLAAGAQCVLVSLWPVPDAAVKILLRTFYSALLQGSKVSLALAEAMRTIQTTKHFAHPANWASFVLVGSDVHLSNQVALMGQALSDLLKTPDKCTAALRVVLHLVEKSLQRIHRGHKNAMYTTQKSIENKVGPVNGWKELLISVGFRFEPASNGLPASVFFPQSDPGERLTQCSASLQALLGLSPVSLSAITKLLCSPEYADDIIQLIRQVMSQFLHKDQDADNIECSVSVRLWSIPGCHELLASLGFDLMEVGRDEVMLRMGKQANRRTIQFALQALLAVFDTQEAPKSLTLENSSSLESLDSEQSDTRTVSPPPAATPTLSYPTWRPVIGNQILGRSSTGAFSTYARTRGEPDGRTATMGSDQKGRESDTFTPSPVDTMKPIIANKIQKQSPQPSPHLAINLSHQSKIRCMYNDSPPSDNNGARPDSSSSASSATDWDSGQSTVRRQTISRDMEPLNDQLNVSNTLHPYTGLKKNAYGLPLHENHTKQSSTGSLVDNNDLSQNNSEFDFCGSNSDLGNLSSQISNFNLSSSNVKGDMKKKSCLFSTVVNKTMGKEFSRKGISKLDQDRSYYKRSATLGHTVETKAQVHQVETISKHYPSSETGIYAPCLEGKTQENIDIHEIRVPSTIGCNPREKSLYVPQAFHNSLMGKKDHIGKHMLNTQLRHLSQELPDVYHDRNVGLGLAPSLSTILAADNISGLTEDQHSPENNLHSRPSNINNNQKHLPSRPKPPLPPKRIPIPYNHSHSDHRTSTDDSQGETMNCASVENPISSVNCDIRDQGDGGSFTDLSCPSQNQDLFPPSLKVFSSFLNNIDNQSSNGHSKETGKKLKSDLVTDSLGIPFKSNVINSHDCSSMESLRKSDGSKAFSYYNNDFENRDSGPEILSADPVGKQKDGWTLDTNRNLCTSSTTSDTEGSDMDNSPKNISTVKRNPKHILSSRSKVPENSSCKPSTC